MNKSQLFLSVFILIGCCLYGQHGYYDDPDAIHGNKEKQNEPKWVFGGDFGLNFGTFTYFDIEPIAGYRITPRFIFGGGPIYMYLNYARKFDANTFGGRLMAQYALIPDLSEYLNISSLRIVAQTEYEYFYTQLFEPNYTGVTDYYVPVHNWLIGGGISQPIGKRVNLTLSIMYDVIQDQNSPYSNPIIKVGIGI